MKLSPLWILLLIASSTAMAEPSCESILKQIRYDTHYPNTHSASQPAWQNLSWLQSHFKTASLEKTSTADETTYHWTCTTSIGNSLTAVTNSAGALTKVMGSTNNDNGEAIFSIDIAAPTAIQPTVTNTPEAVPSTIQPQSEQATETPPITTPKTPIVNVSQDPAPSIDEAGISEETFKKSASNAIPLFNKWFGTHVTNETELQKASESATLAYFSKLRSCTPGTYKYPVYNIIEVSTPDNDQVPELYHLATATISAPVNKLCPVKTTVELKDRTETTQCTYSPITLALYTDEFATLFTTQAEMSYLTNQALAKFINLECKKILSEQDLADQETLRKYIAKFKTCTPGTYSTKRLPATIKTVISGFKDGKCLLKATFHLGKQDDIIQCAYSQQSLDFFADSRLKRLNDETKTNPDKITPEMLTIMENAFKECDSGWQPL